MKLRIRASGIVLDADNRILLVNERSANNESEHWMPPGGGFEEQDSSMLACMQREVWEETGLVVQGGRLIYIREFAESSQQTHHLELSFLVRDFQGEINFNRPQELVETGLTRQTRWFSQEETKDFAVYPKYLREEFWVSLASGLEQTKYLGVTKEGEEW